MQDRRMTAHQRELTDRFMSALDAELVPVSISQARIAGEAHRRYGPGSGSPARLNLGDCLSYALAQELSQPLLFAGDGLSHADVLRVEA